MIGQIDIDHYRKVYKQGEVTLKKRVKVSFFYSEAHDAYHAKVSHRYEKLYLNSNQSKGLTQVAFNPSQDVQLQRARYFKLDSAGEKTLIENVKVKYADEKDYFIENIFYNDLKVKQFNCSVYLPKDYVVSYSYDVIYTDLKFLTSFFFQQNNVGMEDVEISFKKNKDVDFHIYQYNLMEIEKEETESTITYSGKKLRQYKPTSYSVKGNYYLPHVVISVEEYRTPNRTQPVLNSTTAMYEWYNTLIKELHPDDVFLKQLSAEITSNLATDEEKIQAIFTWVQANIQYVAFEDGIAGFKPSEAQDVVNLKYGDCKGMANLLVNLLRAEGFDARHVWVGTRGNNYSYKMPSLIVDNHMICGLKFNGQTYYLDGTSKSASWDHAPAHIEGKEVLIANGDTYELDMVQLSPPESNVLRVNGKIDLSSDDPMIDIDVELTGHFYRDFNSYSTYSSLEKKPNVPFYFIQPYLDGVKIDEVSEPTLTPEGVKFNIKGRFYNIAVSDHTAVFPFLDILALEMTNEKNPPIYIDFPQLIDVTLELDNGGKLASTNYPMATIGNDFYSAKFYTEVVGNKQVVRQQLRLNVLHSPIYETEPWFDFMAQVKAFNFYPLTYE